MTLEKPFKQGTVLVVGTIFIGVCYQLIPVFFTMNPTLEVVSTIFNAFLGGILAYVVLRGEFIDWFKHFSLKWVILGSILMIITGVVLGNLYTFLVNDSIEQNTVTSVLSWNYFITHVPFLLMGEELLSIPLLYGIWKKWGWKFWQASLLSALLFSVWHLAAYNFNLLQILILITPSRLILNYLFKKTNSILVAWIVHILFDLFAFLPFLL
nr:CPBP family intramembrane glutamic endopeptidase [Virgibacillus sp. Bac330]